MTDCNSMQELVMFDILGPIKDWETKPHKFDCHLLNITTQELYRDGIIDRFDITKTTELTARFYLA